MNSDLSEKQLQAFELYKKGKNMVVLGPAGTGKSHLIQAIYRDAILNRKKVAVTALTGAAAILLGCDARTIHSWAGIGILQGPTHTIIENVLKNRFAKSKWKSVDTLIIDEISMMSAKMFNVLLGIAKKVNPHKKIIQFIFLGDAHQLPPIATKNDEETGRFCFESEDWYETFPVENHIILSRIFRQTDISFVKILDEIRHARLTPESTEILMGCVTKPVPATIHPTKLFPRKQDVEYVNRTELARLTTPSEKYRIKTNVVVTKKIKDQFTEKEIEYELNYLKNCLICDDEIELKINAQVMSIINIVEEGELILCNGSTGIVIGFSQDRMPIVHFHNGIERTIVYHSWMSTVIGGVSISAIPLLLSYSLTIYKAQGITLDNCIIDIGSTTFGCGMSYVALSRVKSLEGLFLKDFDPTKIKVNPKVVEFYKKIEDNIPMENVGGKPGAYCFMK